MRMVVTARKASVYGRSLVAGEQFDCPDKEAKLWSALARAHPVSDVPSVIELTEIDPEAEVVIETTELAPRRRGRPPGSYSRRDMRADED